MNIDLKDKVALVSGGSKGSARRSPKCSQFPAYTASKHALLGLTKGTAGDYAKHKIRINSVSPGVIRTPLTMAEGQKVVTDRLAVRIPVGRLGESEEIASTVAFLLSDLSTYTTGADVIIDGAFLLRE